MTILARIRVSSWSVYLLFGLLTTAGYFALPSVGAQSLAYDALGLTAVAAMLTGIRLHRPAARLPWYLLALGGALAVAGDMVWTYDQIVRGIETPFPSHADALYLGGTVTLCAGVLLLARTYTSGEDRAAPLDTAMIAIGAFGISWVFLIGPQWANSARPLVDRLVSGAYPALDVLILAALVRLLLGSNRRTVALQALALALACNFVADIAYTILLARGQYHTGHPIDVGWLLAYVLQGTIALHPSMRDHPAIARREAELPRGRLVLLAVAGLTGPALLAVQAARGALIDVPVIVATSSALFLLVLARLRLLAGQARGHEARFRALVQSAADGVAIVGADGTARYQSPAVAAIIGYAPDELLGRDIFARVHPDDRDTAARLFAALVAEPGGARVCDLRVRHADDSWRVLEVRGTNLLGEPAIAGIVLNYRDITERTLAEAAQRAGEERLRAQYDGFPLPTLVWRREGDDFAMIDFNTAASTFNGGSIAALLGTRCRDLNRDRPQVVADFARCYAERGTLRREYTYRAAGTAEERHLAATYVFVPPDLIMAHTEDITERLHAEAALREREAQFRFLFAHNPHPMWVYDAETLAFLEVNDAALVRYGYTRAEFLAMTIADIRPANTQAHLHENLAAAQSTVQASGPWTHRAKDGRAIAVEIASRAIEYAGRPAQLVVAQEVTARLEAEAALRESERDYRELLERAADAILIADRDGRFVRVNARACDLTGYGREELLTRRIRDIVPADEAGEVAARVDSLGAAPRTAERLVLRKDGAIVPTEVSAARLDDGRVQFIIRDIAARKAAEAELREVLAHARCLLWHAEIAERPDAAPDSPARYSWRLRMADESAAQRVLPLDVPAGRTYNEAWRTSRYPDDFARINENSARALREGAPGYRQEFRCSDRYGAERWLAEEVAIEAVGAGRWRAVGICVDITDRKASEAALREEERRSRELHVAAERQARELALLDRVRTALARELDPPGIHRAIVEATAEVFRTRVSLYLREGDELVLQRMAGEPNAHLGRITVKQGILGRVARTGVAVLLADVESDPEFIRARAGILSEVCVPLMDQGQVIGVLNAESEGTRLGEADLRLLTAIGQHTSTALARARLYTQARTTAENLAAAQAVAHLGSWEYDFARKRLMWSDEIFRIIGHAPQAFTPSPERMLALVHPDDRQRVRAAQVASIERDAPYEIDHRIVRPDGEVRVVHQQAQVIRDAAGQPVRRFGVVQDVTERSALEGRLQHQALHDALTGLPNRVLLLDRAGQALARARRDGPTFAVLFLDLDNFKTVNDTLGHDAGDRLLVTIAGRLRAALREEDTLARLGGDEFAAVLESVSDGTEAAQVAERLAAALEAPVTLGGQDYRVAASIGVVVNQDRHERPEDLLRDADVAMYRAKEGGKARYAIFDPAMQAGVVARLALDRDLRRALERGEFTLAYQPIIDLRTGTVAKLEALLRWHHPERGVVAPAEFIPAAEESGLIRQLGRWVLAEACHQARAWADLGVAVPVAVNLTAQEFQQPSLVAEVAAALAGAGLAARWLRLEITESLAMRDAAATVATLAALRALGVLVAIDDFGTGYSSLAYLKRLPVDMLKIDRAFIDGLGDGLGADPEDTAIVEAIVTLAHTLGLSVVAEGVETVAQAAQLRRLGCDLAQGYHFARPLPADDVAALLLANRQCQETYLAVAD